MLKFKELVISYGVDLNPSVSKRQYKALKLWHRIISIIRKVTISDFAENLQAHHLARFVYGDNWPEADLSIAIS